MLWRIPLDFEGGGVVLQVVDQWPEGVFFRRISEPTSNPRRFAFRLGGELFRRFEIREAFHPANGAVRITALEVPTLGWPKVVPSIFGQREECRATTPFKASVRLTGHVHEFSVGRKLVVGL